MNIDSLTLRFERFFRPEQATVLAETIHAAYTDLVKTSDFNELKEIVRELAEAQDRTEARVGELAEAQNRTEARIEELTQAQLSTDGRLDKLIDVASNLAQEMAGLSRSVSYSLENEAYRQLPAYLEAEHGIVLDERMVRTDVEGEEINIFALGHRGDVPIVLVGESKLQLDRRRGGRDAAEQVMDQLANKAAVVKDAYPDREIVQLLITHYARPAVREVAATHDVILVQSFEW